MTLILHITSRAAWERAAEVGHYSAPSLDSEGFIHCSTLQQTLDTANKLFRGQEDLLLLCIDEDKVRATIKYEAPASDIEHDPEVGDKFPHIYGLLNLDAVIKTAAFPAQADGVFVLPADVAQLFSSTSP